MLANWNRNAEMVIYLKLIVVGWKSSLDKCLTVMWMFAAFGPCLWVVFLRGKLGTLMRQRLLDFVWCYFLNLCSMAWRCWKILVITTYYCWLCRSSMAMEQTVWRHEYRAKLDNCHLLQVDIDLMTCSEKKYFEHMAAKQNGWRLEFGAGMGALIEAGIDDSFQPSFV